MALPANIAVTFDFSSGPTFSYPFTIGDAKYGVLGTGALASSAIPEPTVDLTPDVTSINIKRTRNIVQDTYEVGTATIRVNDPNSYFNPQNTSSPYYGYLTPLRKIRVSATVNGNAYFLGSFYTTAYIYTYPTGQETGYVDIQCSDAFRLFNMANVQTVSGALNGDKTGVRIGEILDQMNFPTSMRTIDTGDTSCQADPGTLRTGLSAIKNAEFSEQGAFYVNPSGTAVFKSRTNVIKAAGSTPIEFNQSGGIPYKNLVFTFNDQLIVNSAAMTRVGGVTQTYQNAASIAKYFPHQSNQNDLVAQTDADVANIAAIYVATRAETTIRIDAMTIDLLDPAVPTQTILGLDYFQQLKITNIQPDSSTIVKTLQCQGLDWQITPNKMQVTVTTLEPIVEGFIIGSNVSGIISSSILAY